MFGRTRCRWLSRFGLNEANARNVYLLRASPHSASPVLRPSVRPPFYRFFRPTHLLPLVLRSRLRSRCPTFRSANHLRRSRLDLRDAQKVTIRATKRAACVHACVRTRTRAYVRTSACAFEQEYHFTFVFVVFLI